MRKNRVPPTVDTSIQRQEFLSKKFTDTAWQLEILLGRLGSLSVEMTNIREDFTEPLFELFNGNKISSGTIDTMLEHIDNSSDSPIATLNEARNDVTQIIPSELIEMAESLYERINTTE